MTNSNNTYKNFDIVNFSQLYNWSVQYQNNTKIRFTTKYPLVRIKEFLTRNKTAISIQNDVYYKRATIKVRNGGISLRDLEIGNKIGTKNQFLISKGQFLLSKIDARNGAFGVVPDELDGGVITGNFWTYDVDYSKVNPHYLALLTTTSEFVAFCEQASNGTTNRHYLQEPLFLDIKVPLPSLDEQNLLVEKYNSKINEAYKIESQIESIQQNIQSYLLDSIGIERDNNTQDNKTKNETQYKCIKFTSFESLKRWDFWNYEQSLTSMFRGSKYPIVSLDSYEFIHRKWKRENEIFRYVEIGNVEPLRCFIKAEELRVNKAPSRATQIIKEGDLIIGTTRPYLKKFAMVTHEYDDCVCSSGFQVISANQNYNLNFLYEYLNSDLAVRQFEFYMTGALYPAITNKDLKKILIPLPPLEIQNDIVSNLTKMKEKVVILTQQANMCKEEAKKNFENQIFE